VKNDRTPRTFEQPDRGRNDVHIFYLSTGSPG
jgi:hypothetical protein